jgi:hypothetical protein
MTLIFTLDSSLQVIDVFLSVSTTFSPVHNH